MPLNVFRAYEPEIYKWKFNAQIHIQQLMGGTPSDSKVAEGWLKTKLGIEKSEQLQAEVASVMATRQVDEAAAMEEVNSTRHTNGFKRERCDNCPPDALCGAAHPLHIEGRHVKAMLKEAASVARSVGNLPAKMGTTNKGTLSFIAEHVIVVENVLLIGKADPLTRKIVNVTRPDGILQSFPKNPITRQTGIQYTEFVENAVVEFTIASDYNFAEKEWAAIWLTGGNQGIGAARSQNYGRFDITRWDMLDV